MNCADLRQILMERDDVSPLGDASLEHLAACQDCRKWHAQLRCLEAHVPMIPVPQSRAKERFKSKFLGVPTAAVPKSAPLPPARRPRRYSLLFAGLGTVALFVLTGVWVGNWVSAWLVPDQKLVLPKAAKKPSELPPAKKEPARLEFGFAQKILDCNLQLAQTQNPQERLVILGNLAEVLNQQAPRLVEAQQSTELQTLATLYGRVVKEGIVGRAQILFKEGAQDELKMVASRLEDQSKKSRIWAISHPGVWARPVEEMALASAQGAHTLRELAQGGAE